MNTQSTPLIVGVEAGLTISASADETTVQYNMDVRDMVINKLEDLHAILYCAAGCQEHQMRTLPTLLAACADAVTEIRMMAVLAMSPVITHGPAPDDDCEDDTKLDPAHLASCSEEHEAELDATLGLKEITFKMEQTLFDDLQAIAASQKLVDYRPVVRQVLTEFIARSKEQPERGPAF
ncbi:hypothetical protein [Chromobacterium sphagni]|uniref:Uncharacterized protein n=1 Tax=Chromobacterium sphagni TaxID=1903179 RepID=A0ABX3CBA1_9NEIS|nr:hypothetical protein [Chromobacterium sphagni]OHX19564.1 hypothetical protein BI344_17825 [Chromobacterium sphagni]